MPAAWSNCLITQTETCLIVPSYLLNVGLTSRRWLARLCGLPVRVIAQTLLDELARTLDSNAVDP
jgi:hypothetical protein